MLKKRNILVLFVALLTLSSANNLFANKISTIDDLLLEVENQGGKQDPVFTFDPKRWGVVEGRVSDEVAKKNTLILNTVLKQTAENGITTFKIDEMDAYFDVTSNIDNQYIKSKYAVLLPSNFELVMSNDTHMRVQPNKSHTYALLMVYEGVNIKVSGGKLYGDRWEHNYNTYVDGYGKTFDNHEWGHVLQISGGKNIVLENMYLTDGMGDGFTVNGTNLRNSDGSPGKSVISENVTLKNSVVIGNRRNGLSLLDGNGVLVENCKIHDTGLDSNAPGITDGSGGTWPKYGVSFEAWRVRDDNNQLLEYSRIENVVMRGNDFAGNSAGDIVLFTCSNIIIEENTFDSRIGNKASNNIIIRNNTMTGRIKENGDPYDYGLNLTTLLDPFGKEFNYDYEIYGNKISGYRNAMVLSGEKFSVHDNVLDDFKTGINLGNLKDSNFYSNKMYSDVVNSYGYASRGGLMEYVNIKNEDINVTRRFIDFYNIIGGSSSVSNLVIDNCQFYSEKASYISNCKNITIKNSSMNRDFDITSSSSKITLQNNKIN